jgi:hypothetical protein
VRREVRHLYPRQNQKAGVVRHQAQVAPADLGRPPDEAIAGAEVARRRRPRDAPDRAAMGLDQVLQVLANRILIPEVVILRE